MLRSVFLLLTCAFSLCGSGLMIGRGAVKITSPAGTPMGGGFCVQTSTGIHDDLYCKAIAFADDDERAAIVSCDVESLHDAPRAVARYSSMRPRDFSSKSIRSSTRAEPARRVEGTGGASE